VPFKANDPAGQPIRFNLMVQDIPRGKAEGAVLREYLAEEIPHGGIRSSNSDQIRSWLAGGHKWALRVAGLTGVVHASASPIKVEGLGSSAPGMAG
jgi:hypothetical protein